MSEKPATKLNRLYKKLQKTQEGQDKIKEELRVACEEAEVDYNIFMMYMNGDEVTRAVVQSLTTSYPVVQNNKEVKPNGNRKADTKKRGNPCDPNH